MGKERGVEAMAAFGAWRSVAIQKDVAISTLLRMFVIFAIQAIYATQCSGSSTGPESESEYVGSL
jgi:hypothetical protein